MRVTITH